MSERSSTTAKSPTSGGIWTRSAFWDEVEAETEALDVRDFAEFLLADREPIEPGPAFRERLRVSLRRLIRQRYAH